MAGAFELPMFPLSCVVFPYQSVPLHVFEPRYRQMIDDVLAADGRFGICLIARGPEVGGGDQRTHIGTQVRVVAQLPFDDGRSVIVVEGRERIVVREWLDDAPYPRAMVEYLCGDERPRSPDLLSAAESAVRALRVLECEMNPDSCVDRDCGLDRNECVRTWQLCAIAPLATVDHQRLLAAPSASERLRLLAAASVERYRDLERQLALDADERTN